MRRKEGYEAREAYKVQEGIGAESVIRGEENVGRQISRDVRIHGCGSIERQDEIQKRTESKRKDLKTVQPWSIRKCLLAVVLMIAALAVLSSCGKSDEKTIKVGASPAPHAEILKEVQTILEEKGYKLEIIEINDYVQPNLSLDAGDLDANYFQHKPYLDTFNQEKGTKIVPVVAVHFEPLGIYAGTKNSLNDLAKGDKVAVPNDTTNEARALQLLQAQGLILLKEGVGLTASKRDIIDNPMNLEIVELEAAVIPGVLGEFAVAVINGNFALGAGLSEDKVIVSEDSGSEAARTFANILAVRAGDENSEKAKVLAEALRSEKIKEFITSRFKGVVQFVD